MPTLCLAYLLDTPDEPGVVVTYRCTRPAGHPGDEHTDEPAARTWTGDAGVTWAEGAVFPVHTGWPWDDTTPAPPLPTPGPPTAQIAALATVQPWPTPRRGGRHQPPNGTVTGVSPERPS